MILDSSAARGRRRQEGPLHRQPLQAGRRRRDRHLDQGRPAVGRQGREGRLRVQRDRAGRRAAAADLRRRRRRADRQDAAAQRPTSQAARPPRPAAAPRGRRSARPPARRVDEQGRGPRARRPPRRSQASSRASSIQASGRSPAWASMAASFQCASAAARVLGRSDRWGKARGAEQRRQVLVRPFLPAAAPDEVEPFGQLVKVLGGRGRKKVRHALDDVPASRLDVRPTGSPNRLMTPSMSTSRTGLSRICGIFATNVPRCNAGTGCLCTLFCGAGDVKRGPAGVDGRDDGATPPVFGSRRVVPDLSMTLQLGILLALVCAVRRRTSGSSTSIAARAPPRPWTSATRCGPPRPCGRRSGSPSACSSRSRAWVFHVAALALAPMSVVQVVLAGGVVLLAVMAERLFGFEVGRRQWIGLGCTAVGLILLGVTAARPRDGAALRLLDRRHDRLRGRAARRRRPADPRPARRRPGASTTASCSAPPPASSSASPTSPSRP